MKNELNVEASCFETQYFEFWRARARIRPQVGLGNSF
jgi:hypothetical protein